MGQQRESNYSIASKGLATSFAESELPIDYASIMTNGFINAAGGMEKRQGITQFANVIPGGYNITGLHELVKKDGTAIIFASSLGRIFRLIEPAKTWTLVHQFLSDAIIQSVNFSKKIIFYNGVDRSMWSEDATTFYELKALVTQGTTTTPTSVSAFADSGILNWVTQVPDLAINDIMYNIDLNAYGTVVSVGTASIGVSPIGIAAKGVGTASRDMQVGDRYQLIDYVELNILPTLDANVLDNAGIAGAGTNDTTLAVDAFSFIGSDIRIGDAIYNTTQNALTFVTAIATAISVVGIAGQVPGDSLILLKSAMPIGQKMHTHFGRLYIIDARDSTRMFYSGPANPQDFSATNSGELDIGSLQPTGESFKNLQSFQRYLVIGGTRNLFFYAGTDPTLPSSDSNSFQALGVMPAGQVSRFAMVSVGNDIQFISPDGVIGASLVRFATQLGRYPISGPINTTLRTAIRLASEDSIQAVHYQRRSWVLFKIGAKLFCFNYTPAVADSSKAISAETENAGSWSLFDGPFAQANCYLVRENQDLLCGGANGLVTAFDQGTYDDIGSPIDFVYRTGWLKMVDPKTNVKQKMGKYIKPLFQAGAQSEGTIYAEAPFNRTSTDTVTFVAGFGATPIGLFIIGVSKIGGSGVTNEKLPLRWKGEAVRLTFSTSDTEGPFILARFTLFASQTGTA